MGKLTEEQIEAAKHAKLAEGSNELREDDLAGVSGGGGGDGEPGQPTFSKHITNPEQKCIYGLTYTYNGIISTRMCLSPTDCEFAIPTLLPNDTYYYLCMYER